LRKLPRSASAAVRASGHPSGELGGKARSQLELIIAGSPRDLIPADNVFASDLAVVILRATGIVSDLLGEPTY
jgi:hypothetical protein